MKCMFCGCTESKVLDSRANSEGDSIRRRRECLNCGKRFTTYEIIESLPIIVIKKDKSREVFNRDKLVSGMLRACEKRPVSLGEYNMMNDTYEILSGITLEDYIAFPEELCREGMSTTRQQPATASTEPMEGGVE